MKTNLFILFFFFLCNFFANAQIGWHVVPKPPPSHGRIEDVSFVNDSVGWLDNGRNIFKTSDRGETWDSINNTFKGHFVRSIEFINEQVGFVGTLRTDSNPGLFKTIDGGITFTRIDSLLPVLPNSGICGIAHLDNLVLAVGAYWGDTKIYKSKDTGNTWSVTTPDSLVYGIVDVFIIDSLNYLVGGTSDSLSGFRACILRTSDGGITWKRVAYSKFVAYQSYCWKLFMRQNGTGFGANEYASSVFITQDTGNTWQEITIPDSNATMLGGIALLNDSLGWVGNQGGLGLFETTDKGQTWKYNNFGKFINRMITLDSSTVLAVGSTVYKYGSGVVSVKEPNSFLKDAHELKIYPNPASKKLTIDLNLSSNTPVAILLIDENGRRIMNIENSFYRKGEYKWSVNIENLSTGYYGVQVLTNEQNFGKIIQIFR